MALQPQNNRTAIICRMDDRTPDSKELKDVSKKNVRMNINKTQIDETKTERRLNNEM